MGDDSTETSATTAAPSATGGSNDDDSDDSDNVTTTNSDDFAAPTAGPQVVAALGAMGLFAPPSRQLCAAETSLVSTSLYPQLPIKLSPSTDEYTLFYDTQDTQGDTTLGIGAVR